MDRRQTVIAVVLAVLLGSLVLACGGGPQGMTLLRGDGRWACPSPTPKPWGENGPVKEVIRQPRPTTTPGVQEYDEEPIYFGEWEQEYGELGDPPFPSPTPYGFTGTTFVFGQRVEVGAVHVTISARAGPRVDLAVQEAQAQQLYTIEVAWSNPTGADIPIQYDAQLRLRAIVQPDGATRSDGWSVTSLALAQARLSELPDHIPPGESQLELPILAPPGVPKIVELSVAAGRAGTPIEATPTANTELRRPAIELVTLQWLNSSFQFYGAPACGDPGAVTDWNSGDDAPIGVTAPPGAARLIEIELNQVGKRYVWGASGPETFDCSGLQMWSYAQIGISIPRTTATQWPGLRPIEPGQLQPGDLAYMDTNEVIRGQITHVGMLADVNGDGRWDLIHAASPKLGVRIDYDVFHSAYYAPRLVGFRTVR